ncbi:MAG: macro domain-containing protein [candidate division WOR-3 bacterium]
MIKFTTGNILESEAQALVNTVNTVGVMGKGIALQFKKSFPDNFNAYAKACKSKEIEIGKMFVFKENTLSGEKIIINFPTKKDWRKPSEYEYIEKGLDDLIRVIKEYNIKSIAIPPLGAGSGGLLWEKVKTIIQNKLGSLDIDIFVYEPSREIQEKLKKERVKLTDARALMLYVLYELVRQGEYVSEFSAEKVCYFLQKFGAEEYFKLTYKPNFYGPYSGKVRYVLNYLNGSYIMGYSDITKKPFEPLLLIADRYDEVNRYIQSNKKLQNIAQKTIQFLDGFFSDFALELLSTVDWIMKEKQTDNFDVIKQEITNWNYKKRSKFSNDKYIQIAIEHIKNFHKRITLWTDKT